MIVGTTIASMMATESIRMVLSAAPTGPCGSRIFIAEPENGTATNGAAARRFHVIGYGDRMSQSLWRSVGRGGKVSQDENWCCQTGLNCRPLHYQWSALPLSYGSMPGTGESAPKGPYRRAVLATRPP